MPSQQPSHQHYHHPDYHHLVDSHDFNYLDSHYEHFEHVHQVHFDHLDQDVDHHRIDHHRCLRNLRQPLRVRLHHLPQVRADFKAPKLRPDADENLGVFNSPYYVAEVNAAIANMSSSTLKSKAANLAKIPNFTWLDTADKVPTLTTYLADAQSQSSKSIVQIVIYDLPDRDCHAKASNGEYHIADNGVANYKAYIDSISSAVSAYPGVRVVAVVEPDSLANLVTNMSDSHCANAHDAYLQCTTYVLQKLTQCNIWLYLDAGHAGWLGWASNQDPAAQLFAQVYKSATPNRVRGLATNVANYNALHAATPDPITQGDPCTDELSYVQALGPKLTAQGFPAHFIIDQGRSGQQNLRQQWGDWCNIKGAGFGLHPTTSTPDSSIDAIVWVKPGGESDGTSDSSSSRYDSTCSLSDAKQPAPEAGTWFEAYFEDLLTNANPAL
ncbi:Beta-glucosidase cel3A [Tulasnella sp. UAMH 9824]|nr:Beta-glucosidase cel3A [Tulasnella sp. UAMH 9824]